MIELKDLHKSYDGQEILKGIDFKINKGDVIAVLGPSGSGKTTLLRCLNFLTNADSGTLLFNDSEYDMAHISKKDISSIRQHTGFVFQNYNLFLNKTVLNNVQLGLQLVRKMEKQQSKEIAIKALEKVGMGDYLDFYPYQLSGGQQQRVSIARALAYNPDVIYFDEPTSALDPELINEVMLVLKDLANSLITMVVVTHEMNFARNISNKILFMEKGELLAFQDSQTFFKEENNQRIKTFLNNINTKI